jgi:hypothetical protein
VAFFSVCLKVHTHKHNQSDAYLKHDRRKVELMALAHASQQFMHSVLDLFCEVIKLQTGEP